MSTKRKRSNASIVQQQKEEHNQQKKHSKQQQQQANQVHQQQQQEKAEANDWQTIPVKLETLDEDLVDIKPDVHELQPEILPQQQPSPQQQQQPAAKRVFVIGGYTAAGVGLSKSNGGGGKKAAIANTTTTPPVATVSKSPQDSFAKDKFDLQESDSDEEGYSDIDIDEDDELVEGEDDTDLYDPTWTDQPTTPRMVFSFDTPHADVGLVGRPKSTEPLFYFDKLLLNRQYFFTQLAEGCNKRAQETLETSNGGQVFLKLITSDEMEIFFGLCLQMSTMKLPTVADYWNEQALYGFKGFGGRMSLNRFQMLMRVLSFDNLKDSVPGQTRKVYKFIPVKDEDKASGLKADLGGAKPLLDFFNRRMEQSYECGQRLVLNEPMMYWKGKFNWLNDMNEKFRDNALTLHFLTEHTGLVLKIVPYMERKEERKQLVRNSKLLVSQRVMLAKELLKEKLENGHTVFVSKYYGSYGLGYELGNHATYCTGLLDNKRYGNCKQLILNNLLKKSFSTTYASALMMCKWRRREKCVYFYSSDCLAIYAKETASHNSDPRPKIIKELDWQLRASANIREYMLSYQVSLERKEIKWDMQLAIYVFNLLLLNAYVLYTMYAQFGRARVVELHLKDTTKLKSYAEFRQDIIASLLKTHVKETDGGSSANAEQGADPLMYNDEDEQEPERAVKSKLEHVPMMIPRRQDKVMKKKCRICRKGGMLTFSKVCCEECPGMPGLCQTPCFKIWHDQLKKSMEADESIKTRGTSKE